MFDLLAVAFQSDITRVFTFMMSREASQRTFAQLDLTEPWHTLSHHGHKPEKLAQNARINLYNVGLFANFAQKLAATADGDGTLLDHSLVLYGSGMSDGNQHNHTDLPVVLAGGASGRLKGGRHLRHPKNTPMANLLVAMLDTLDIPTDKFGDSNGEVSL